MRRIRIALIAFSAALLVPITVLTWRALDGLASQRVMRHEAVAERAFDEMERTLSQFLAREEERPFEHFHFYLDPEAGERSPLAMPSTEPFVLGAFQIDPDGSVHTPLSPRDADVARRHGDWPPPTETRRRIDTVTRIVRASRGAAGSFDDRDAAEPQTVQAPGTTRMVGAKPARNRALQAREDAALGDGGTTEEVEQDTAYDVLRRLNVGARSRTERKQKVARAPSEAVYAQKEGAASRSGSLYSRPSDAPAPPPSAAAVGRLAESSAGSADLAEPPEPPEARGVAEAEVAAVVSKKEDLSPAAVRVAIDPMVGRLATDDTMLLIRTVLVGPQGYQQGLVIDRRALGEWLERRVISPSGLAGSVRVAFLAEGETPDDAGDAYVFQHRFAEPFDPITARLSLATLPGVGSPGAIYGLVALLVAVGAAGLFAVHRMVAVAVHFAERRNNFVAAVTHELKTPLTAIRMYAEMLRDGIVETETKRDDYYRTITDESERLSRLIDNVLEFSRLERGAREMSFTVGSVETLLEEAAGKLRTHAAHEGFALEVRTEPGLPPIRFDRDALLQVIFNLVDNAMKYARGATAKAIVLEARRDGGGDVMISVRDFGPGVSGRHMGRIFEPFDRPEDELTRNTKGTGIGLALVKDLAERMGAGVSSGNEADGGFRVCLSFRPAEATRT